MIREEESHKTLCGTLDLVKDRGGDTHFLQAWESWVPLPTSHVLHWLSTSGSQRASDPLSAGWCQWLRATVKCRLWIWRNQQKVNILFNNTFVLFSVPKKIPSPFSWTVEPREREAVLGTSRKLGTFGFPMSSYLVGTWFKVHEL